MTTSSPGGSRRGAALSSTPGVVTPWTARLADPQHEVRFRAHHLPSLRRDAQVGAGLVAAYNVYSGTRSALEVGLTPGLVVEVANNVALILAATALAVAVRRLRSYDAVARLTALAVTVYSLIVVLQLWIAGGPAMRGAVMVVALAALVYLHAMLPLLLTAALAAGWSAVSAFTWAHRSEALSPGDVAYVVVMTAVVNVVGLVSAHRTSHGQRQLFAQRQEMARLSGLDGLTGLANRRALEDHLHGQWQRCVRHARPFSLLLVDVDLFKQVNDREGHARGDEVLRRLAAVLESAAGRPGDLVARYGGEEFAVLLPDTDRGGAERVADRVLSAVRDARLERSPGTGVGTAAAHLTVSIGAGTASPAAGSAEELLATADALLYRAKEQGRDRVVTGTVEEALLR